MRKLSLTFLTILSVTSLFAQNTLRKMISTEQGTSKQMTILPENQRVPFNPDKARSIFGLDNNTDLVKINTDTDKLGMVHYRYRQTYKNIPIENTMYIAHTRSGQLTASGGNIIVDFTAQPAAENGSAGITAQSATEAAIAYVHADKFAWQDSVFEQQLRTLEGAGATYYPTAVKVWYSGEVAIEAKSLKLAYKVDVYSLVPFDRKFVYLDVQTGKVLGEKAIMMRSDATSTVTTQYSGAQNIHTDFNGTTYQLRDYTKGRGIITLNGAANYSDFTSSTQSWTSLSGNNRYALDAHFGAGSTWSYFNTKFGRNSIDNNGYQLTTYVNDPYVPAHNNGSPVNAFWDGYVVRFGYMNNGQGLTAIDITGHELTHGLTQFTSQLTYSGEPGAINESMSDIMGKSVQFYAKPSDINWQLSNDMNWIIRDLSNPNVKSQPDTYNGSYWINTAGCMSSQYNDYCGLHTNSGVGNYMFYLLVAGGSGRNDIGNSFAVTGIGIEKADQILYRTNSTYLTPTSMFADWRTACIRAATDLYGAGSNEVTQTTNAWYAVGVGAAAGSCGVPSGLSTGAVTAGSAALSWAAVTGAQSYTLQWKAASASAYTTVTGITSNSYTISGLTAGTAYTAQVATVCTDGTSAYSSTVNFTTATAAATDGLAYKYYEGSWNALPDFNTLTPVKTGISSNTDISVRTAGRNDNFAFLWQGYINITTPGTYTFETISDDGSKFYFNTLYNPSATATVNNNGLHEALSATGTVDVPAAGSYPVSITFFEKEGGEQMQVYWSGPGFSRQLVPNSVFTQTAPAGSFGLAYKYYEGSWSTLPDFSTLTPVKTGSSTNTDSSVRPAGRYDNFGFVWQGYINITTPGTYTFETVSDDGSKLYFNTLYDPAATATVNNDGVHAGISATGTVNIGVAGVYPISITFFEKEEGEQMQVYWTGPNFARQIIPNSAFTQASPPPYNGLSYKYYEGSWSMLPDFNSLTPVKTGTSVNTDLSVRPADRYDNFAFLWQGYINITTPGNYTFETVSDDGSKLYFNSLYNPSATATVNNNGLHEALSATGTVNIGVAGVYPISITFFEKDGGEQMQVYWTGPNFTRQLIPNLVFRTPNSLDGVDSANGSTIRAIANTGATGKLDNIRIYPNPFAASVSIDFFNSSSANNISAGIYDLNGRLVHLYHAGTRPAGNNTLQLNLNGEHLADGYYYVKISVNGAAVKTVKLVKAKQ